MTFNVTHWAFKCFYLPFHVVQQKGTEIKALPHYTMKGSPCITEVISLSLFHAPDQTF